jgi:hypothetical protein
MTHGTKFSSAKLQSDGTVKVTGPFSPEPGEPDKPVRVAFYLVQGSTKVDGEGRWMPGDTEWSGTAESGLRAGSALAGALAVGPHNDPPGFLTFSWSSNIEIT